MMDLLREIRIATRTLLRSPSLTLTALLALVVGISANTALFTIVNAVLLRPLNYPGAGRIVQLTRHYPGDDAWAVSPTKIDFWRSESRSFEAVAATSFLPSPVNLASAGGPERVSSLRVTSEFATVFGVAPAVGRFFSNQEDRPGSGNYAVLSSGFWARRFGRDPVVIGKSLPLSGTSYTIIGIMPPGFASSPPVDLFLPLQLTVDPADRSNDYCVLARLKDGVTPGQAQSDMHRVAGLFRSRYGKDLMDPHETISVFSFQDWLTRGVRSSLLILMAAVGFVLLIACANVANLLLARAATRQREIGVRIALGASGWQIARQLLFESLILSVAGTVIGSALAGLALPVVLAFAPAELPHAGTFETDWRVLLFTAGLSVVTAMAFGLVPALQAARLSVQNSLRETSSRTATSGSGNWIRQSLVVFEVALSLVLLVGAGLLLETFVRLSQVDPGFEPRHVLTMQMSFDETRISGTAAVAQIVDRIERRVESVTGVSAAGATSALPLRQGSDLPFRIMGRNMTDDNLPDEFVRYISPHYFTAMGMKMVAGRGFSALDNGHAQRVLIVNEAFSRKFFPHGSALGERILVGVTMGPLFKDEPREIVGIVNDTREVSLGEAARPVLFEPMAQTPDTVVRFFVKVVPIEWVIRASGDPLSFAPAIRREALLASGGIPMGEPHRLEELVGNSIAQQRFLMALLSVFAGLALFLGAIGIYGVISYGVARRTRELGIRSALGAARGDLLALVLRQAMTMSGAGLALGLAASAGLSQFLRSTLYGVTPTDARVLVSVTVLLAAVSLAACYVPARRAASIDPVIALREE